MFFTLVVTSSCALSIAGGDVLSTRSTGIVFLFGGGGAIATARRRLGDGAYAARGSVVLLCAATACRRCSSAAWLPPAAVKKIKFLTKSNMSEYVSEDQMLEDIP